MNTYFLLSFKLTKRMVGFNVFKLKEKNPKKTKTNNVRGVTRPSKKYVCLSVCMPACMYVCMYTLNVVANLCKEGNILINDTLNTFYLRLSSDIHMLKDHSDSKTRCPHIGSTFKDRSDDPSHHERTLLPRSYISLPMERRTCFNDARNTFYFTVMWRRTYLFI